MKVKELLIKLNNKYENSFTVQHKKIPIFITFVAPKKFLKI